MQDLLLDVVNWIEGLPPGWIYATILAVAYLENVVPPFPGDMVIVFGGYLVGMGLVGFFPIAVLASVGGAVGFMTMYALGWKVGGAVFDVQRMRWVPKRPAWRARAWLVRYGYYVVAMNRFLSGLRSVIALSVGAARMRPSPTAGWATFSSTVWSFLMVYLGFLVGERWEVIGEYLDLYGRWVLAGASLALGLYLILRAWRGWRVRGARRSGEDPAPVPGEGVRH